MVRRVGVGGSGRFVVPLVKVHELHMPSPEPGCYLGYTQSQSARFASRSVNIKLYAVAEPALVPHLFS